MPLSLILALQAAAAAPTVPPGQPAFTLTDFDLARLRPAAGGCERGAAGEVLVCGRRGAGAGAFPLDYWARIFPPTGPIRAEMDLGGNVRGRAYAEQKDFSAQDRGAVSNRFMVGIRWPF